MSGSILQGVGTTISAIGSLLPTNTSGYTTAWGNGTSDTTTKGTQNTVGEQEVTNSADPGVIAALKSLVATATSNAEDSNGQTNNLVAGIFQSAKDAFASTFGTAASSGIYNSATTGVLSADAEARATADAAQAVLGYQTSQEQIAAGGLQNLLQATATQNTATDQTTTAQQTADTDTTTWQHSQQAGSSKKSLSIICTRMYRLGLINLYEYSYCHRHYDRNYNQWQKVAYEWTWAPLLYEIGRNQNSLISRTGIWLFSKRTKYVAACEGYSKCERTLLGYACKKLIFLISCPMAGFTATVYYGSRAALCFYNSVAQ